MQMVGLNLPGERRVHWPLVSSHGSSGGVPQANRQREGPEETMACKETNCGRRAHSLGWCTTHYRRSRSGKPMDAPIRRYRRRVRWKRKKPFEAEYALLAELGLRRN
jgi:hypothetical protein